MPVWRLNPARIAIRFDNEYREAGGVAPIVAFVQSGGGFIHVAPEASDVAGPGALKRFHDVPQALRRMIKQSELKAFWLVALRQPAAPDTCDVRRADLARNQAGDREGDVSYSWLFVQSESVSNHAWIEAASDFVATFQRLCICRCRNSHAAIASDVPGLVTGPFTSPGEIQQAIGANATPFAWGLSAVDASIEPRRTAAEGILYAAVPHCNSSRMMFAYRGILRGDDA